MSAFNCGDDVVGVVVSSCVCKRGVMLVTTLHVGPHGLNWVDKPTAAGKGNCEADPIMFSCTWFCQFCLICSHNNRFGWMEGGSIGSGAWLNISIVKRN